MAQYLWLPLGAILVLLSLIALSLSLKGKFKNTPWLILCSLGFSLLFLPSDYALVMDWVRKEDFSAMLDVVPARGSLLTLFVIVTIMMNIVSFHLYQRGEKKKAPLAESQRFSRSILFFCFSLMAFELFFLSS